MRVRLFFLPLMLLGTAAAAQPAQNCPPNAPPLPAAMRPWQGRAAQVNGGFQGSGPQLEAGVVAEVSLQPVATVTWRHAPGRAPAAGTRAGLIDFEADFAGTYRMALSSDVWLDVVGPNGPVASSGQALGPACSGIDRIVDFRLQPGRYTIQLSGVRDATIRFMILMR